MLEGRGAAYSSPSPTAPLCHAKHTIAIMQPPIDLFYPNPSEKNTIIGRQRKSEEHGYTRCPSFTVVSGDLGYACTKKGVEGFVNEISYSLPLFLSASGFRFIAIPSIFVAQDHGPLKAMRLPFRNV